MSAALLKLGACSGSFSAYSSPLDLVIATLQIIIADFNTKMLYSPALVVRKSPQSASLSVELASVGHASPIRWALGSTTVRLHSESGFVLLHSSRYPASLLASPEEGRF